MDEFGFYVILLSWNIALFIDLKTHGPENQIFKTIKCKHTFYTSHEYVAKQLRDFIC